MQNFHECPYCGDDLEQWSLRFYRSDRARAGEQSPAHNVASREEVHGRQGQGGVSAVGAFADGLTLLSLCPHERCGYYVLRYRNGLTHWDRDVEAARLLRTVFGDA